MSLTDKSLIKMKEKDKVILYWSNGKIGVELKEVYPRRTTLVYRDNCEDTARTIIEYIETRKIKVVNEAIRNFEYKIIKEIIKKYERCYHE